MSHTTAPSTATEIAAAYFDAWQARDFDRLRELLADDVTFVGTLGTADGAEECVAGLRGMAKILDRIEVHTRVADEHDVITWFDLHTTVAAPAPTANWMHVANHKITAIRVTFDPRGILAAG
jgi:ketosteroid isomerase-like protein